MAIEEKKRFLHNFLFIYQSRHFNERSSSLDRKWLWLLTLMRSNEHAASEKSLCFSIAQNSAHSSHWPAGRKRGASESRTLQEDSRTPMRPLLMRSHNPTQQGGRTQTALQTGESNAAKARQEENACLSRSFVLMEWRRLKTFVSLVWRHREFNFATTY